MNIDIILRQPITVRKHLQAKEGDAFREWLDAWQKNCLKIVTTDNDDKEILRAQGELRVLNRIIGLPEEIRKYQEDVRNKKVQPVTASARTGLILK